MLVQYYYPFSLSSSRLDRYLASGWFRNSVMLFRSKLLCMEGELFDVVNIRLDLKRHTFPKKYKKLMNRNSKRFTYRINKAGVNEEKNDLYALHKRRFKGFIYLDLHQFLYSDTFSSVFNTYEVEVYDGDKLVALSYFDVGEKSMASLIGIYHPDYSKYSLGNYTMLLELQYAMESDLHFYYPGYIFSEPSIFDYKLKLGNFDYYDWHGKWKPYKNFELEQSYASLLYEKIDELCGMLSDSNIPYTYKLYPLFPLGYMEKTIDPFVKGPVLLFIGKLDGSNLIIEYLPEENMFDLATISWCPEYDHLIQKKHNNTVESETIKVLKYDCILHRERNLESIVKLSKQFLTTT